MNDDEIRQALREEPDATHPLDPAKVIAGAHRRRKVRGLVAVGVASVALVAIATGGIIAASNRPAGSPSFDPPVATPTPSARTTSTPGRATPSGLPPGQLVSQCRAAVTEGPKPGATAAVQGVLQGSDGVLVVIADSKYWMACDNTYRSEGKAVMSARQPATIVRPAVDDTDAFAVANNLITQGNESYEFYWAAGLLPAGVSTVRYTFPEGAVVNAVVNGNYWMVRHQSAGGGSPDIKVRVQLVAASGSVIKDFQLQPGTQTCAQISHGC